MNEILEMPVPVTPVSAGGRWRVLCWVAGGPQIGMGHVRRSVELARTLEGTGFEIVGFVCNDDPCSLLTLTLSGRPLWREKDESLPLAATDLLLVDRPAGADSRIKDLCRDHPALRIAALDSFDMESGAADLVINLINHHPVLTRPPAPHQRYHEGPEYAIIRREFVTARDRPRFIPLRAHQVLVTFGGADPRNHSSLLLEALAEGGLPETTVRLVVGPNFSHATEVIARARSLGVETLEQVADLAPSFAEADVAICGGGTTMLELACVGTPTLVLPQNEAENRFAASLAARGAVRLGRPDEGAEGLRRDLIALVNDQPARRRLNTTALTTVDGLGQRRIAELLLNSFTTATP